ncbi:MAG: CRTAC1 family protein, partial [Cyanothece sp. SIO1E1]|nr:CRTAC1 family protein [Cyanothece sp. SIO1E1]
GIENGGWGWGTQLFDFENDGDYDLIMTNGWHIFNEPENKELFATLSYFWRNDAGNMTPVLAEQFGLRDKGEGKGLLTFDYDRDGDLDVFIANNGAAPVLYRNDQDEAHAWIQFRLQGERSNTRGIGARLQVVPTAGSESQVYELTGASHFCGQSEAVIHIGLGEQDGPVHSVQVAWPSGQLQMLNELESGVRHLIEEPTVLDYQN